MIPFLTQVANSREQQKNQAVTESPKVSGTKNQQVIVRRRWIDTDQDSVSFKDTALSLRL